MDPKWKYYVYRYLRTDGSPYYGKGCGKRAYKHCKDDPIHPPKDLSRIEIVHKELTEEAALALEVFWISYYGRMNNGTGILRNQTEGGMSGGGGRKKGGIPWNKGITGYKQPKISAALTGRQGTFKGKTHTNEAKKKMSDFRTGKVFGPYKSGVTNV